MKTHDTLSKRLERGVKEPVGTVAYGKGYSDACSDVIDDVRDLESENAALTKRVAELEQRLRFTAESLRSLSPGPHPGPMDAEDYVPLIARLIESLQSQLEAKDKRVAGLEEQLRSMTHMERLARESNGYLQDVARCAKDEVRGLQSQLAWTPVSAGLPTEPGFFVFEEDDGNLEPFWLVGDSWENRSGEFCDPAYLEEQCRRYRRIELSKAAVEYHAQGDVPKAVLDIVQEQYSKLPKDGGFKSAGET